MAVSLKIHDRDMKQIFGKMAARIENKEKRLRQVGDIVRESVRTNFAQGGRPARWKPLQTRDGQPLRRTGRLMESITSKISGNAVRVGTNAIYAAVQNFGSKKGSFGTFACTIKAHKRTARKSDHTYQIRAHTRRVKLPWGDIPPRRFMMVQKADLDAINAVTAKTIVGG